jgi:hypothetical protein
MTDVISAKQLLNTIQTNKNTKSQSVNGTADELTTLHKEQIMITTTQTDHNNTNKQFEPVLVIFVNAYTFLHFFIWNTPLFHLLVHFVHYLV